MKKFLTIIIFLLFFPVFVSADGLTLSITPPMIKNNVTPGQVWKSSIKVINNNAEDVEIYTQVLDFKSGKTGGTVEFLPEPTADDIEKKVRLSSWIVMDNKPLTIPAFKSQEVSFIIDVPKDAQPGGHYTAVLVGTTPPKGKTEGSAIKISSMLSSLILLNVAGDVNESGRIREFSVDKDVYLEPKVDFDVRFENLGNVHIQPQGEIRVYNFFGKDKGVLNLNHESEFGNVLPGAIREWNFTWEGDKNILEMGRYKAELVLTYGNDTKETIDQTLYFWVVYLRPLLIAGGVLLFLIIIFIIVIKSYIRRSIKAVQGAPGKEKRLVKKKKVDVTQSAPIKNTRKVLDLRASSTAVVDTEEAGGSLSMFRKMLLFILVVLLVASGVLAYMYFTENQVSDNDKVLQGKEKVDVLEADNTQEETLLDHIEVKSHDATPVEDVIEPREDDVQAEKHASTTEEVEAWLETQEETEVTVVKKEDLVIKVLNGSGVAGMATKVVGVLEEKDFVVNQIGNADSFNYEKTVVSYAGDNLNYAEEIKALLDRKAVVKNNLTQEEDVIIIIGKSLQ